MSGVKIKRVNRTLTERKPRGSEVDETRYIAPLEIEGYDVDRTKFLVLAYYAKSIINNVFKFKEIDEKTFELYNDKLSIKFDMEEI